MATHSKFRRGSGCFTCAECGKRTRDVNGQNGALELCPLCQSKAECGNSLSDAGFKGNEKGNAWKQFEDCQTVAECEALLEKLVAEGGAA